MRMISTSGVPKTFFCPLQIVLPFVLVERFVLTKSFLGGIRFTDDRGIFQLTTEVFEIHFSVREWIPWEEDQHLEPNSILVFDCLLKIDNLRGDQYQIFQKCSSMSYIS